MEMIEIIYLKLTKFLSKKEKNEKNYIMIKYSADKDYYKVKEHEK